jgi:hypothetical protein
MKIEKKVLFANVNSEIICGGGSFKATVINQIILSEGIKGIEVENESMDIVDISFMGMPIKEGYSGFRNFTAKMLEMGIDIQKMIQDEEDKLDYTEVIAQLKKDFTKMLG